MTSHNAARRRATNASGRWPSILVVCTLLMGLLPTSLASASMPPAEPEPIVMRYEFSEPVVSTSGDDHAVHIEGLPNLNRPGEPRLPIKTARLLVPFGLEVAQVRVIPGRKVTLEGTYRVEPGQEPARLSDQGPFAPTPPSPAVYGSAQPYPGELHSPATSQSRKGYRFLVLTLYPMEYQPQSGMLSYYESLTVQVDLQPASWETAAVRMLRHRPGQWATDRAETRALVDNPAAVATYPTVAYLTSVRHKGSSAALDASTSYDYVIITNDALLAAPGPHNFQALKADKNARGVSTNIVTVEWIATTYTGSDLQTKIRNFVIDAYQSWGIEYVLLGGDGDGASVGGETGDIIIPHRGFASISGEIDYDIPADMYYGCLDGTFNYDGDSRYGEPTDGPGGGEVDLYAEVYVGRAAVDSEAELADFVRKTLAYQVDSDEYLHDVWMVGELLWDDPTWGGDYKDEIKEGATIHGYTTVGFEDSPYAGFFNVQTLYDRDYPGHDWPTSEIVSVINSPAHIINHLGHSNVGYMMKMVNSDVDTSLTNDHYFIGYSQGCYDGAFDNRSTSGSYHTYDCICEHIANGEHGAVAFVGNSRYGWGEHSSTDGASQYYDRQYWDAVLGEDIFQVGKANQDSKEDTYGVLGSGGFDWVMRWCYYELNVFGDPELMVKVGQGKLEIGKTVDQDPVPVGGLLTYEITVHNTGLLPVLDVVVSDAIPMHTTFHSADGRGTLVGAEVRWADLTVPANGSQVLHFSVTVDSAVPDGTVLANSDYSAQRDGETLATGSTVTTTVAYIPALTIGKESDRDHVPAGDVVTYTLTVHNAGLVSATDATISDAIPAHAAFRYAADGGALVGDEVRWTGRTIAPGASLVLRFSVTADTPVPQGTVLINDDYGVQCAEGVVAVGEAVSTPVDSAPVLAVGGASSSDEVSPGDLITYTFTVHNTGNAPATAVAVSNTIPVHMSFHAADPACTWGGGEVRWAGKTVPAGDTLVLRYSARVDSPLPNGATLVNDDYGVQCAEGVSAVGHDVMVAAVHSAPVLTIGKTSGAAEVSPGDVLTYTITVHNTGNANATGVVVTDTIPTHTAFHYAAGGGTRVSNQVQWTGLVVPAGGSLVLQFSVTVDRSLSAGTVIVNDEYGVCCAEGIAQAGDPVTTSLRWYSVFFPIVLRQ